MSAPEHNEEPTKSSGNDKANPEFTSVSLDDENDYDEDELICRICHSPGRRKKGEEKLIQPCLCRGTLGNVHKSCIERWLSLTRKEKCTICGFPFKTKVTLKPIREWIWPPMDTDDIIILVLAIFVHLTVFIQISTMLYVAVEHYQGKVPTTLGIALTGIVVGMPWTLVLVVALSVHIALSHYWRIWRFTNRKVKLVVDDLQFYHNSDAQY